MRKLAMGAAITHFLFILFINLINFNGLNFDFCYYAILSDTATNSPTLIYINKKYEYSLTHMYLYRQRPFKRMRLNKPE